MRYANIEQVHHIVQTLKDLQVDERDVDVHEDDDEIVISIRCGDFFYWACADAENITIDNLILLQQSIQDILAVGEEVSDGLHLFCARSRKMRPQGAVYRHLSPALHSLFNACGPERPIDFGNPQTQDAKYQFITPFTSLSNNIRPAKSWWQKLWD